MGEKGAPQYTGSSRKPGSSQIFRHLDTGSHIRTTARTTAHTWTAGLAALGPGRAVMELDRRRNGQPTSRVGA
jgi:hypothetical protein